MNHHDRRIRRFALRAVQRASDFDGLVGKCDFFRFQFTPLMVVSNWLDLPGDLVFRLFPPRVIKCFAQLWCDKTGFAMTEARAVKLHKAKPEYRSDIFP